MNAEPEMDTPGLADLLGVPPKTFPELKKIGAIVPGAGRQRWKIKSSVQNYAAHLRRMIELKASDAAELSKQLTAKKIIKTDAEGQLAILRVAAEKGQLIESAAVRESGIRIGAILTARLGATAAEVAGAGAGLGEKDLHRLLRDRFEQCLAHLRDEIFAVDKKIEA